MDSKVDQVPALQPAGEGTRRLSEETMPPLPEALPLHRCDDRGCPQEAGALAASWVAAVNAFTAGEFPVLGGAVPGVPPEFQMAPVSDTGVGLSADQHAEAAVEEMQRVVLALASDQRLNAVLEEGPRLGTRERPRVLAARFLSWATELTDYLYEIGRSPKLGMDTVQLVIPAGAYLSALRYVDCEYVSLHGPKSGAESQFRQGCNCHKAGSDRHADFALDLLQRTYNVPDHVAQRVWHVVNGNPQAMTDDAACAVMTMVNMRYMFMLMTQQGGNWWRWPRVQDIRLMQRFEDSSLRKMLPGPLDDLVRGWQRSYRERFNDNRLRAWALTGFELKPHQGMLALQLQATDSAIVRMHELCRYLQPLLETIMKCANSLGCKFVVVDRRGREVWPLNGDQHYEYLSSFVDKPAQPLVMRTFEQERPVTEQEDPVKLLTIKAPFAQALPTAGEPSTPSTTYLQESGIPELVIEQLRDQIAAGLPRGRRKEWSREVLASIPLGADLSGVWPQFAVWMLTDPNDGVIRFVREGTDAADRVRAAIEELAQLLREGCHDRTRWQKASAAAEYAMRVAETPGWAAYATRAVVGAAANAAWAAARRAARAAARAAANAAWEAAAHGKDMAREYAYLKQSDKLLELLRNAPQARVCTGVTL